MAIPEVITSGPNSVSQLSEIKSIRSSQCDSTTANGSIAANGSLSVERILVHSPSCSISSMPEMRRTGQNDEQFAKIHPRPRSLDWIEPAGIEPDWIEPEPSGRIEPMSPDIIELNRSEPVLVEANRITGNRKGRYNSVRLVGTSKDNGKICVASRAS